jgi:hypothetical protein
MRVGVPCASRSSSKHLDVLGFSALRVADSSKTRHDLQPKRNQQVSASKLPGDSGLRMSFGKIWMISPCTCLAHQRWPVVKFGQHIAGMMRPLAKPMNPRLEHSTWIVVAAGGDRHMTSRDARSMIVYHNEAFERRSPGHRCVMSAHVQGRRGAEGHA